MVTFLSFVLAVILVRSYRNSAGQDEDTKKRNEDNMKMLRKYYFLSNHSDD